MEQQDILPIMLAKDFMQQVGYFCIKRYGNILKLQSVLILVTPNIKWVLQDHDVLS